MAGNKTIYKVAVFTLVIWFLHSCSTVKYVPDGKYLLNKVAVDVDNKDINKEELNSYVRQKGNLKILGIVRFHLWLYNMSSKKKTDGWLKRIGEEPVIYNEILTQRTNSQIKQYLSNKGYYNSEVENSVYFNDKKKKVNLTYKVNSRKPYRIRNIEYHINDTTLRNLFFTNIDERLIKQKDKFDVDLLDKERNRIVKLFKNYGYYYFSKDNIFYLADTSLYSNQVDIDLRIRNALDKETGEPVPFKPYRINKFEISTLPVNALDRMGASLKLDGIDTLRLGNYSFYNSGDYFLNPRLYMRFNSIQSGDLYRVDDAANTFNAFNKLRQFRFINIQFDPVKDLPSSNLLDCDIQLSPLTKQNVSFDIEGTNTSGNLGIAGNLNYMHRNLFHGAEIFRVNLKGGIERQQSLSTQYENFNTVEFGFESNITIPTLTGPGRLFRYFDEFLPQTVFTLGYNFQRRPIYTRTISNLKYGYDWKTSEYLRHTFNLLDFSMIDLYEFDPEFINSIADLYIKSSFTDHFIVSTNYSLVYNTQVIGKRTNYKYLRFTFESAGNFLNLLSKTSGLHKTEAIDTTGVGISSYYKIFEKRYAQYVKADLEFRYGHMIDKYNAVVGRAFIGVGLPYGNFDVLPFEKKYFTGGANGIRAWQVRSLGPGSYNAPEEAYPNQSSDVKLEANVEYRFRLIKMLEGAIFFDAGNIWAINDKDNREGAIFKFNKFYKQIALGTGVGFRFDFNYFIFRLDTGMKLHDPTQDLGNGWIIGNRRLKNDDFNISFAIDYPF